MDTCLPVYYSVDILSETTYGEIGFGGFRPKTTLSSRTVGLWLCNYTLCIF